MNTKAQVSIEVLIILGIFVIGAILFGAYYINVTRTNIAHSDKLDVDPVFKVEYAEFDLELKDLNPSQEGFSIQAEVNNYPTGNAVSITSITPQSPQCTYLGSTPISMIANDSGYYYANISGFTCTSSGSITIKAKDLSNPEKESTTTLIKTI